MENFFPHVATERWFSTSNSQLRGPIPREKVWGRSKQMPAFWRASQFMGTPAITISRSNELGGPVSSFFSIAYLSPIYLFPIGRALWQLSCSLPEVPHSMGNTAH